MEINELIKTMERQLAELKELAAEDAAKKDDRPVTERIKTFDDALRELGDEHPLVRQWRGFEAMDGGEATLDNADLVAYYKLRIITAALNEGWTPQFTGNERRYYPDFSLYTAGEWDGLSEGQKQRGLLVGGYAYYGSNCGFACVFANGGPADADADCGSRLCYKTGVLAEYSGNQFADLWMDYYLIRRG